MTRVLSLDHAFTVPAPPRTSLLCDSSANFSYLPPRNPASEALQRVHAKVRASPTLWASIKCCRSRAFAAAAAEHARCVAHGAASVRPPPYGVGQRWRLFQRLRPVAHAYSVLRDLRGTLLTPDEAQGM